MQKRDTTDAKYLTNTPSDKVPYESISVNPEENFIMYELISKIIELHSLSNYPLIELGVLFKISVYISENNVIDFFGCGLKFAEKTDALSPVYMLTYLSSFLTKLNERFVILTILILTVNFIQLPTDVTWLRSFLQIYPRQFF